MGKILLTGFVQVFKLKESHLGLISDPSKSRFIPMINKTAIGIGFVLALTQGCAASQNLTWSHVWTHAHENVTTGQSSEISAFDAKRRELWVIGGTGLEILGWDAAGAGVRHRIDLTAIGTVNSVAISGNLAAVAIANAVNSEPGVVQFYDVRTRSLKATVEVGANPDMVVFTAGGERLLVANEGERANNPANPIQDPEGSVSIIRIDDGRPYLESTASFPSDVAGTEALRAAGVRIAPGVPASRDIEPEYIAVDASNEKAVVTLQENNAYAVLDIERGRFSQVVSLGLKDFGAPGNVVDLTDRPANVVEFAQPPAGLKVRGLYQPDSVAGYKSSGRQYFIFANEGDARSDGSDEARASTLGVTGDIGRLTISTLDSTATDLVAFGGRSFTIRDERGNIVYDSGNLLDKLAIDAGLYDDGRSDNKGVEPEGVAVRKIGDRWIAFIGFERTTTSAVAMFDVTDPRNVQFLDLLSHAGDASPEGLVAFGSQGTTYLAVSHEGSHTTTLYKISGP
jgi:hypothetical protein